MPFGGWNVRAALIQDARAIAAVHVESSKSTYAGIFSEIYLNGFSVENRDATTMAGWWDSSAEVEKGPVSWAATASLTPSTCFTEIAYGWNDLSILRK